MRLLIVSIVAAVVLTVAGGMAVVAENAAVLLAVVCVWNPVMLAVGWGLAVVFGARPAPRRRKSNPARVRQLLSEDI